MLQERAGGWSEVAKESDVMEAGNFAVEELNPKVNLKDIISSRKQVVKGYIMRLLLG